MAAEYVQQITDKIEKRFMNLVKRLKAAYDVCVRFVIDSPRPSATGFHFYLAVRSIIFKLTKGNAPGYSPR